jgi:peptidoglycan-associated lipoprotein
MKKIILGIVVLNLLVACANSKPKVAEVPPTSDAVAASPVVDTSPVTQPVVESKPTAVAQPASPVSDMVDPLNDPSNILAQRSVYYALDSYAVADANKALVQAHAKYLSEHPARKVRIEGNADERGSNEYNLALGQRRADSVKKMLILGGAKDEQIEASSFGEEKPKAVGHDESSWSQNRRTDFKY